MFHLLPHHNPDTHASPFRFFWRVERANLCLVLISSPPACLCPPMWARVFTRSSPCRQEPSRHGICCSQPDWGVSSTCASRAIGSFLAKFHSQAFSSVSLDSALMRVAVPHPLLRELGVSELPRNVCSFCCELDVALAF